jgi:ketosteroid isomerase-like protein/quercetin dioxygenase-like cupin family protein
MSFPGDCIMSRLATLVVVAAFTASCAHTVNVEQEKAALMAADAEWLKTVKDIDKFVSYFTPDGTMGMAGMPAMKGPQAIKASFGPMMQAPGFDISWKATRAEVAASGDLGWTAGTYAITMNNPAGSPMTEHGKYVTNWKKIAGAWKVVEDTGGPDGPVPVLSPPVVVAAAAVKWTDAPPSLPKGAKLAVLVGDPSKSEPFTIRLQMPDGYKIAPHTHPTDEHVTVLSGTFRAAMGKTWDDKALGDLAPGSYANMAATMPHFAMAKGTTVVQVHGIGPFVINYVNPADDPSKAK